MSKILHWSSLTLLGLALSACPEEPSSSAQDTGDGETDGEQCDPVGANAEQGELLNAPVEADVEVIVKEPQHPGAAGPDDLP